MHRLLVDARENFVVRGIEPGCNAGIVLHQPLSQRPWTMELRFHLYYDTDRTVRYVQYVNILLLMYIHMTCTVCILVCTGRTVEQFSLMYVCM